MNKTIFAVCIFIAAGLAASGQRRPKIFVPTPTQPAPASTPKSAPGVGEAGKRPAAGDPAEAAPGHANKAAIEYESLMTMRFYEETGGFLVEGLEVVFPPSDASPATFVVTRPSGEVIASVPLRLERLEKFPAFGIFRPAPGNPGIVRVAQAGDFVMAVRVGSETITTLPFSLRQQGGDDPFNPVKKFVRDGPWSDLAFFSVITDEAGAMLHFNYWLSTRELPPGINRPKVTLHLLAGGKEIAASRAPVVPDTLDWYFYERKELIVEATPKQRWLALSDLTKQDGEIVMLVKADGRPLKSYKTRVVGGRLQTLERSRLNTQPRTDFISPRYVDITDRSRSDFTMRDMFWVKKSQ